MIDAIFFVGDLWLFAWAIGANLELVSSLCMIVKAEFFLGSLADKFAHVTWLIGIQGVGYYALFEDIADFLAFSCVWPTNWICARLFAEF